jgi:hypothetical protein
MAKTNAEYQAAWRERNISKRRDAQRIVNLLVRKRLKDEHVKQIGAILYGFLNRHGLRTLRRALKEPTQQEMDAIYRQNAKAERDLWLREHPGRTVAEYKREVLEWRGAKWRAVEASEAQAYERDHPGEQFPEHECGLSPRESSDLARWRRLRLRRQQRARDRTT